MNAVETVAPTPVPYWTRHPQYVAADVLSLILMPTEKCNFRCTYCYEDFVQGRMGRPVVEGVKALIAGRAPGLSVLRIEWFGGEPLLELSIVEEIQAHVGRLQKRFPRLDAASSMTTNAYFWTADVQERLVGLGVRSYQITLDGSGPAHDVRRKRADGAGTFERIWANLVAAHRSSLDFEVTLRMHVDRDNVRRETPGNLWRLIDRIHAELGGDPRFQLFIRRVSRLGGPNDAAIPVLPDAELGRIDELKSYAAGLGLRVKGSDGPGVCYAATANSFVVRSSGELAKCTVALSHPANRVGYLRADGSASVDGTKVEGWVRGLMSGDEEALHCPMKGYAETDEAPLLRVIA